jgi:ubiquitin-like-conjugating enzyme ATG3
MKKFIDRMDEASGSKDGGAGASGSGSASASGAGGAGASGKKGKWGIGGMVRRVTGSGKDVQAQQDAVKGRGKERDGIEEEDGRVRGVQVDFYLVIVRQPVICSGDQGEAAFYIFDTAYGAGTWLMSSF